MPWGKNILVLAGSPQISPGMAIDQKHWSNQTRLIQCRWIFFNFSYGKMRCQTWWSFWRQGGTSPECKWSVSLCPRHSKLNSRYWTMFWTFVYEFMKPQMERSGLLCSNKPIQGCRVWGGCMPWYQALTIRSYAAEILIFILIHSVSSVWLYSSTTVWLPL